MTTRISNLASSKLILSAIAQTQGRMNESQIKLTTGFKAQNYAGLASDAHKLVTVEASRRRVDQFLDEAANLKLRMDTTLNSIDALKKTLDDTQKLVKDVLDDGQLPNGIDKDSFADVKISEIEDFLNVRIAGRFMFAGSMTDTKPVEPGDMTSAPAYDASFNTVSEPSFYYQGDDTKLKARLDEGVEIQYGITADNPAFEKLVRAVRIIRSTPSNDANIQAKYQEAADLLDQAQTGLEGLELNVGTKLEQLVSTGKTLNTTKNFLNGSVSDIETADPAQTSAELLNDQNMLEASYNILVRLSNLSLTKYLN